MSHSFVGILHWDKEEFYSNNITQLEEQPDLIKLSQKKMAVVKSALKSVNKSCCF
jgi:hypothetical protein